MNKIYIVSDVHCRNFYKPILNVKDSKIIFLGDYMDPYFRENTSDEQGITNLEEIFDFARKNPNVILLVGNHDSSHIWSYMGFERTSRRYYAELHRIYRDNIDLLHPIYRIEDTIFTHAGISANWIYIQNEIYKNIGCAFRLSLENILDWIENEFKNELEKEVAVLRYPVTDLESPIFDIGSSRGGDCMFGGPLWSDFYSDYDKRPWDIYQICGHQQRINTGTIGLKDGIACVDSRAIFEYDLDTHIIRPSLVNNEAVKKQIEDFNWKTVEFTKTL